VGLLLIAENKEESGNIWAFVSIPSKETGRVNLGIVGTLHEQNEVVNSCLYANVLISFAAATIHVEERRQSIAALPKKLTEIKSLAPQDAEVHRKVKLSVDPSLKVPEYKAWKETYNIGRRKQPIAQSLKNWRK